MQNVVKFRGKETFSAVLRRFPRQAGHSTLLLVDDINESPVSIVMSRPPLGSDIKIFSFQAAKYSCNFILGLGGSRAKQKA